MMPVTGTFSNPEPSPMKDTAVTTPTLRFGVPVRPLATVEMPEVVA